MAALQHTVMAIVLVLFWGGCGFIAFPWNCATATVKGKPIIKIYLYVNGIECRLLFLQKKQNDN